MWEFLADIAAGSFLNQWIQTTYWLWPVLEIVHFLGLSLLIGGLLVVDLRMIGVNQTLDLRATHQMLPVVLLGFVINAITGVLFFYGDPMRYSVNIGFQIKMALILFAGLNAAFFHLRLSSAIAAGDGNPPPSFQVKLAGSISLATWAAVLLLGRLIPYVGTG
ncbi:MAG: hypothetical protein AB8B95_00260 [Pseudohongiellaceae bacterium]